MNYDFGLTKRTHVINKEEKNWKGTPISAGSHIDEVYWISGSDMITENDWRWFMQDGYNYPMNYTNWLSGRPDNSGGNENCLSIVYHGTRTAWNDDFCYERHSFICEAV